MFPVQSKMFYLPAVVRNITYPVAGRNKILTFLEIVYRTSPGCLVRLWLHFDEENLYIIKNSLARTHRIQPGI